MVQVFLDGEGRLQSLDARTPGRRSEEAKETGPVDWAAVVEATGLSFAQAVAAETVELPPVWADTLRAWTGPDPHDGSARLHIDAASAGGSVVFVDASFRKDLREEEAKQAVEPTSTEPEPLPRLEPTENLATRKP